MPIFMFYARRLVRRPLTLLIALVMPVVFAGSAVMQYQAAITSEVWLAVADPTVHDAITSMLGNSNVEWRDIATNQVSGTTGVGLKVDDTLAGIYEAGKPINAEVVSTTSGVTAALLTLRLNSVLTTITYLAANTDTLETFQRALNAVSTQDPSVQPLSSVIGNENSTILIAIFNMVIFVMMLLIMTNALTFLSDKVSSTTQRVLVTTRNKLMYYAQIVLVFATLGAFELGLMMAVMRFGFHLDLQLTFIRGLLLFLAFILLSIFTICLGLLLISRTTKTSTGRIIVTTVVLPMCMLSGTLWPSSVMPKLMQKGTEILPPKWVTLLNEQFFSGLSVDSHVILLRMVLLVAVCAVLFAMLSRVHSDKI